MRNGKPVKYPKYYKRKSGQTVTRTCSICGRDFESNLFGRPREMHDDCKKLSGLFSWSEDLLQKIDFDPEYRKKIRSRLFSAANLLNCKE